MRSNKDNIIMSSFYYDQAHHALNEIIFVHHIMLKVHHTTTNVLNPLEYKKKNLNSTQ